MKEIILTDYNAIGKLTFDYYSNLKKLMSEPVPAPDKIKTLYMIDQYPDWTAPHPRPISNYRSLIVNRVDNWHIWSYYMELYHIQPSFQDLGNYPSKPVHYGLKVSPADTELTDDLKQCIVAASPYWNMIQDLCIDEPRLNRLRTDKYAIDLFEFTDSLGLARKPLNMSYSADQIRGLGLPLGQEQGWKSDYVNRVGFSAYPRLEDQNVSNLAVITKTLCDEIKAKVGDKCQYVIFQAYDRNGLWTNRQSLIDLQYYTHEACKSWAKEYWYFNLDRETGNCLTISGLIDAHDLIRSGL